MLEDVANDVTATSRPSFKDTSLSELGGARSATRPGKHLQACRLKPLEGWVMLARNIGQSQASCTSAQ